MSESTPTTAGISDWWHGWFIGSLCGVFGAWFLIAYGPILFGLPHVHY